MGPEVVNKNKDCVFNGPYAGRDLYITMYQDSEREFVVTHNANIKPVSYFTGRETELQDLRQRIEKGRKSVLVSGMGGIGKTHICRKLFEEYLNKHSEDGNGPFRHIGYIEYNGDMGSSLQNGLKFKQQESPEQNQEAAWRELEHLAADGKLLLFVDNVDKPISADLGLQRLKGIPGAVVLTSRQISFGDEFNPYRIGFLSMQQCIEIYERIRFRGSGKRIKPEEVPDLEYVIENLAGRHTITVELLAHLARTKTWTVKKLRGELEEKGFRLAFHKDGELVNIQKSYEVLYDLSELTEAEQNILEAFSIFPYIPLAAEMCNEWLLSDAGVSEDDDILMGLYQKGWLQFDVEQEGYAMHPVFSQFIYEKSKPRHDEHYGLIEGCQKCLEVPENGVIIECEKYIPYGESILKKLGVENCGEKIDFVNSLAYLLLETARYDKAGKLYRECLEHINMDDLSAAEVYNNLASVYKNQGKYKEAEEFFLRSLQIYKSVVGENNSLTAVGYHNLAWLYEEEGKYEKAERSYIKSIQINERVLGENHPDTARSYRDLGWVYESQGKYGIAEELCRKSLQIYEDVLGKTHPDTIRSYNALAVIYTKRGEYGKAEELYRRIVQGYEKTIGRKHLEVCNVYNNLAYVYMCQGKYKNAEELYKTNLQIRKNILGKNHIDTAISYHNLADLYQEEGKYEDAKRLYMESLRINEIVFSENHPETARNYNALAMLYENQGENEKAERMYWKSLQICKGTLGEEHLHTVTVQCNLAELYKNQAKYEKAEELQVESIRICEKVMGKNYPHIAVIYNNLAEMYAEQRDYEKSLSSCLSAFKIFCVLFGMEHPDTQIVYENLKEIFKVLNPKGSFEQWIEEQMKGSD